MFATLSAEYAHFLKWFFAVLCSFARSVANGATEVSDSEFCFSHNAGIITQNPENKTKHKIIWPELDFYANSVIHKGMTETAPVLEVAGEQEIPRQQQGAREAEFTLAVQNHYGELLSAARRTLGNNADAQDAVQEVFKQACKNLARYLPGTNMRAWLYAILFYTCRRTNRKRTRDLMLEEKYSLHLDTAGAASQNKIADISTDTSVAVIDALEQMRSLHKEVVRAVDLDGLSYKEASEILGVPVGTIMSRLHRGRKQLRRVLMKTGVLEKIKEATM